MRRKVILIALCAIAASITIALMPKAAYAQNYTTIIIQPGDSLGKIANQHCTTWQTIYNINRQTIGPNPHRVEVGMALTVPNSCGDATQLPAPGGVYDRGATTHASGVYNAPYYTVAWGDTIYSIANRFGLSQAALMQANGINSTLGAGQTLIIPGSGGGYVPPVQPQPPAINAERVYFGSGGIAASRTGIIDSGAAKRYVLEGRAGQTMEVNTQTHGVALLVSAAHVNGSTLGFNGPNGNLENNLWATLPVSGDYVVTVSPVQLPEGPQMSFDITFVIQ